MIVTQKTRHFCGLQTSQIKGLDSFLLIVFSVWECVEWEVANTVHMWHHGSPKGGTQAVGLGGGAFNHGP